MENVLDLKMPGVQELGKEELKDVDGGVFGIDDLLLAVAGAVIYEIITDWENFERGLTGKSYIRK
ncbi:MAG: hypothetical protein KAH68_07705 [Draconibacterium sp.]|nr:hypothetical protein [Draconibacterium sp.]